MKCILFNIIRNFLLAMNDICATVPVRLCQVVVASHCSMMCNVEYGCCPYVFDIFSAPLDTFTSAGTCARSTIAENHFFSLSS